MSDIKCPFCQTVLDKALINDKIRGCPKCRNMGNIELWQSLINERQHATDCQDLFIEAIAQKLEIETELDRTRKALDVAVDALKEQQRWLGIIRISMVSHLNNEKGTVFQPYDADPTVLNIGKAKVLLNNALEQITTLEQKESLC